MATIMHATADQAHAALGELVPLLQDVVDNGASGHEKIGAAPAIRHVLEQAFGRGQEADLIEALQRRGVGLLSCVAVEDSNIVGQILFSPVAIASTHRRLEALGLGPMAVLPAYQRQGIGSQLVHDGLKTCRDTGHAIVVVLGHPAFYRRFGFTPAIGYGIRSEFDVTQEVFMLLELRGGAASGGGGVALYQPEFGTV
jgi:putative acetyltransferase